MKKTSKDYIKIVLTILIVAGLFMPYIYGVLPITILFDNYMEVQTLLALTIPILATLPLLLFLIFKCHLKETLFKPLKSIFLVFYTIIFAVYVYGFYNSLNEVDFLDHMPYIVTMALSLILIAISFKSAISNSERLESVLLATIGFPILLYFTYGITNDLEDLNYGSYVLNISFILLYFMTVYDVLKNRNVKKTKTS